MKNFTLAAFAVCGMALGLQGQATYNHVAPPNNNGTSAFRAPNGTQEHAKMRGMFYIHPYEMLPMNLATINTASFILMSGTGSIPVTGNFTLYLSNSADMEYAMGSNFGTAFGNMTQVYAGPLTIPAAAGSQTFGVNLTSPFNFTGGGMYVGYDWDSNGPFAANSATYAMNYFFAAPHGTDQVTWTGTASQSITANPISATVQQASTFRPAMIFGATNTAITEVEVIDIDAPGVMSAFVPGPQTIWSRVVNSGHNAVTNLSVALAITGTNPHTETVVIPSLAAGATHTVNFVNYNPTMVGPSSMTVAALLADQTLTNNIKTWEQNITCESVGQHPADMTYNNGYTFLSTAIWSTKHNFANTSTLTGVKVAIGSSSTNNTTLMYAVLLNSAGTVIATGSPVQIAPSTTVTFPFNAPQVLTGGSDYYIGVVQPTASPQYYPMAFRTYTNFVARPYYIFSANGGAPAPSYYFGYYGIEPVLTFDELMITATGSKTLACNGEVLSFSVNPQPGMTYSWSTAWTTGSTPGQTFTAAVQPPGSQPNGVNFVTVAGTHTASGCAAKTAVVSVSVSVCTGIGDDLADYRNLAVYPNPAVSGITAVSGMQGENTIEVLNVIGQTVMSIKTDKPSEQINFSNLSAGQYILKVSNNKQQVKVFKVMTE